MRPTYKHTQTGDVILWVLGIAALISCVTYLMNTGRMISLAVFVIMVVCAALFCCLTIQIDQDSLRWSFGPGVISKQVDLKEIASAEPVRNSWISGWGIHYTSGGWLYNVSGMDGVQITLKSGKQFRLGTDEPEALTAAIRCRIT